MEDLKKSWTGRQKPFADDTIIQEKSHRIAERFRSIGLVADEIVADKRAHSADSNYRLYWENRSWVHCEDKEVSGKTQPEPEESSKIIHPLVAELRD